MPVDSHRALIQGMCFAVSFDAAGSLPPSFKGGNLGTFSECTGLTAEIGSEEHKEGGNNHFVHKLPSHASSAPVVLKRGMTDSTGLWDWIRCFLDTSKVEPANVQIQLLATGSTTEVLRSWVVHHAYPLKWEGPQLNAMKGEIAFETVELAHRGVTLGS